MLPVDEGGQQRGLLPGALVVAPEQLGQLLVEVEDDVGAPVLARHRAGPELPHEEHLVGELRVEAWKHGYHEYRVAGTKEETSISIFVQINGFCSHKSVVSPLSVRAEVTEDWCLWLGLSREN